MPEAVTIACILYGLAPHEALTASTLNAARVLGMSDELGSLEIGKRADIVVLDGEAFRQVPYRPGHNPVLRTYIDGRMVWKR